MTLCPSALCRCRDDHLFTIILIQTTSGDLQFAPAAFDPAYPCCEGGLAVWPHYYQVYSISQSSNDHLPLQAPLRILITYGLARLPHRIKLADVLHRSPRLRACFL